MEGGLHAKQRKDKGWIWVHVSGGVILRIDSEKTNKGAPLSCE